ncbi:MAG: radical SAM protein [Candidatus Competibacteraceae bacterium]|jgi:MoaA/NifB/PqqE/SkfB family radical SAM enzyme|nr:radical SAM protein [Candidatus Competibacteraceae bacterium]
MMDKSLVKLTASLIKNGIRYHYLRGTGKPGKPAAVSLEVTHECIAQCLMCNIWKIPRDVPSLSLEDWVTFLSSNLFSELKELDITGGEPFLRKDLGELIARICQLKADKLKHLDSIAVTTNGLMTRRVVEQTERMLTQLQDAGIQLVMVCAMDAIGPSHDEIRHVKNAWSRVNATIQSLKRLRERFPALIIGLKTTVLPMNVQELERIVDYATDNGLFTILSPCIITEGRYLNPDRADDLVFSPQALGEMQAFFERSTSGWDYHDQQLLQYCKTGETHKPCSCGFNYCFVRSNGDLFLCPLLNSRVGNIQEQPAEVLFHSQAASQVRKQIGRYPECRSCTEPGLERYSLPYEGFSYLSLLPKMGKRAFVEQHYRMGLDKYFD